MDIQELFTELKLVEAMKSYDGPSNDGYGMWHAKLISYPNSPKFASIYQVHFNRSQIPPKWC